MRWLKKFERERLFWSIVHFGISAILLTAYLLKNALYLSGFFFGSGTVFLIASYLKGRKTE